MTIKSKILRHIIVFLTIFTFFLTGCASKLKTEDVRGDLIETKKRLQSKKRKGA